MNKPLPSVIRAHAAYAAAILEAFADGEDPFEAARIVIFSDVPEANQAEMLRQLDEIEALGATRARTLLANIAAQMAVRIAEHFEEGNEQPQEGLSA